MFTQGKWRAKSNSDGSWTVLSGNIVIAVFNRKDFPEWNEANARLIAAAPDLLAACERVRSWLNKENKETLTKIDCENMLFVAISKAKPF